MPQKLETTQKRVFKFNLPDLDRLAKEKGNPAPLTSAETINWLLNFAKDAEKRAKEALRAAKGL